jgi:hypothetical protein
MEAVKASLVCFSKSNIAFTPVLQKPEGFRDKASEGEVVVFYFEPSATTPVAWQARI